MVKRALCVALGLVGACFPSIAQQAHRSIHREQLRSARVLLAPLSLGLDRSKIAGAADSSLLLHNGAVPLWLDGPQLRTGFIDPSYNFVSPWVQMGFTSSDLFPPALLNADEPWAQRPSTSRAQGFVGKDRDAKDSPDEMLSPPPNQIYYAGEVGFLYGRWSGKGGGDMWETYVVGTAGNDKFQITAGAAFDEWNGTERSVRFRSFTVPK